MDYVYERLEVWKQSVDFAIQILRTIARIHKDDDTSRILEEVEMSTLNIATSIAKGKASASKEDFIFHLYLSRRSLYEAMTLLEILRRERLISDDAFTDFESEGQKTTSMLDHLIRSIKESQTSSSYGALGAVGAG